jgi:M6 family metalloprotease-like protein
MVKQVVWLTLVGAVVLAPAAVAQGAFHPRWEIPGFDFRPRGAWRVWAAAVSQRRAVLRARGDFAALNAAAAVSGAALSTQVSGTLQVPAVLFTFKDTPALPAGRDTASYTTVLFGASPPGGRPYTIRTFYEQMSDSLLSIQGTALGYAKLDSNEVFYAGTPGSCSGNPFGTANCNGIFSGTAVSHMQSGLREALRKLDSATTINWSQFDHDGDGVVDLVIFVQPNRDGACGGATNNHFWAHRYYLQTNGVPTPYVTKSGVQVLDYTMQSGVGGADGCQDTTAIMPIGTAAHETGHAFALPDLYDVSNVTEGIGEWGLMGSGNYSRPLSPSRMEAWSLDQLGWVTVVPLAAAGTYQFGPAPTSDTAFLVRAQGANPRGEYFLLENRQAVLADTAVIAKHGGGGLLIWHVDSTQIAQHGFNVDNQVNVGSIHGLALLEADGLRQLWGQNGRNRGDGGDPYPGTTGNTVLSFGTNPAALKNADNFFAGFVVDSIAQLAPTGPMTFRLRFGGLTTVAASDTIAKIKLDATAYGRFRDLLDSGSTHTIAIDTPQFSPGGRTRYGFASWSDAGALSHTIIGSFAGATYTATVSRAHRLDYAAGGNGAITSATATATFVPEGTGTLLTAVPDSGYALDGWSGDTTAVTTALTLPMGRPMSVTASFVPILAVTSAASRPAGTMGYPYNDTLRVSGGNGTTSWALISGSLGGLTLLANGVVTGFPHVTGLVSFTLRATSGAQTVDKAFSFSVAAPALSQTAVISQLLNNDGSLSADDQRYLDFQGNNNGLYDVGDFLGWVKLTSASPAPPRSAAPAVRGRGGRP